MVDILRFGDDLGTDQGPFMAPKTYRNLFKPRHTQLTDYVHRHSQMKTFLHSCGSIYQLLPDLIEAGYEVINPVQITSRNMEPERLKQEFGKDITFWGGGADTRHILNHGTPDRSETTCGAISRSFAPAAVSSSTPSTISCRMSRPRTSWPCSRQWTSTVRKRAAYRLPAQDQTRPHTYFTCTKLYFARISCPFCESTKPMKA